MPVGTAGATSGAAAGAGADGDGDGGVELELDIRGSAGSGGTGGAAAGGGAAPVLGTVERKVVQWTCNHCDKECIPVREESRCLCGHRLKEHPSHAKPGGPAVRKPFACANSRCKCTKFMYIVAEGAWILRCQCKHKHTDHDPAAGPHKCTKPSCKTCDGFTSPWVCNCDHKWSDHTQRFIKKTLYTVDGKVVPAGVAQEMFNVKRGAPP